MENIIVKEGGSVERLLSSEVFIYTPYKVICCPHITLYGDDNRIVMTFWMTMTQQPTKQIN